MGKIDERFWNALILAGFVYAVHYFAGVGAGLAAAVLVIILRVENAPRDR